MKARPYLLCTDQMNLVQITTRKGPLQRINVMVCTYNEPMETVKSCVEYLLASEAPVYCEKIIYIGDDGAKKKFQCSEDKRVMCEEFHKRAPPEHVPLLTSCLRNSRRVPGSIAPSRMASFTASLMIRCINPVWFYTHLERVSR